MASSNKGSRYARRLFVWLLLYSFILTGCTLVYQYMREKRFSERELNARLQIVNAFILDQLAEGKPIEHIRPAGIDALGELRISVVDTAGRVLYDNGSSEMPRGDHRGRAEIAGAIAHGSAYTVRRHSESTGVSYFYSATRGADGTVVRSAVPYSVPLSRLMGTDGGFIWFMCALTLAMCTGGYFATRGLGREIAAAAREREERAAMHELMEKERLRKQLTNNINHELKTPVASIHACLETLLSHPNMDLKKRTDFLERCMAGSERLRSLLEDVSMITRMDYGGATITRERLDFGAVVREAVADCLDAASAKGFTISAKVSEPLIMEGNRSLLRSMVTNLIGNAVSHSGGTAIVVEARREGAGVIELTVSDNGSGVPEEHIGRIFERFYRVDSGRSRASGGTGLGLAIVKNVAAVHGGSASAINLPTGGLRVKVRLSVGEQ